MSISQVEAPFVEGLTDADTVSPASQHAPETVIEYPEARSYRPADSSEWLATEMLSDEEVTTWRVPLPARGQVIEITCKGKAPPWFAPTFDALVDLLRLRPNWDSYGGRPISSTSIQGALDLFPTMQPNTPPPWVVPTCDGTVQLEWHIRGIDLEVEALSPARYLVSYEDNLHGVPWEGGVGVDLQPLTHFIQRLSSRT